MPLAPPPPFGTTSEPAPPAAPRVLGVPAHRQAPDQPNPEPLATSAWPWLVLGLAAAWLLQPWLPANFTWLLSALPHEMGHATAGCLLGRPSAPAIALHGEAWTGIAERQNWLCWLLAASATATAFAVRARRGIAGLVLGLAVVLPVLAYRPAAEVVIAAAGHAGELLFAAYCFATAWSGGRTDTPAERLAAAFAGGLLQATNLRLGHGLHSDDGARAFYATNGSLGLKNDLLVLAEDLCHCRLETAAAWLVAAAVLSLPLGIAAGVWWRRLRA
jgi:hypothetical protein